MRERTTIDKAELPDNELIQIGCYRTFDRTKAWDNPNPRIPLHVAHKIQNPEAIEFEHLANNENDLVTKIIQFEYAEQTFNENQIANQLLNEDNLNLRMVKMILNEPQKKLYRNPNTKEMKR